VLDIGEVTGLGLARMLGKVDNLIIDYGEKGL
jgi:hypothetical protein